MEQFNRKRAEAAIIALVAEFVGDITGLKVPTERELFPENMKPALNRLCDGLIQVSKECH